MVSYTRAKAEALGVDCKIGIMQRAERLILIGLGAFIGLLFHIFDPVMIVVLGLIALISNITALQRTFYVKKAENELRSKE
jgi:CDP-diacylglycerol--glycerol-3-phosphate 3-phosphatidyltransferase